MTAGLRRARRQARHFQQYVGFDLFQMNISWRDLIQLIPRISVDATNLYLGITAAPLWRMFGSKTHKMIPHRCRFECMEVLTLYTPAYAMMSERHILSRLKFEGRMANRSGGGERPQCKDGECTPIFLYVCLSWNSSKGLEW